VTTRSASDWAARPALMSRAAHARQPRRMSNIQLAAHVVIRWRRDRSVDRCSMTRDAPTAAGGCFTDHTTMPALPMPYNGGRVVIASRASPDEGRGAYAK
jgi:hypothetical protein